MLIKYYNYINDGNLNEFIYFLEKEYNDLFNKVKHRLEKEVDEKLFTHTSHRLIQNRKDSKNFVEGFKNINLEEETLGLKKIFDTIKNLKEELKDDTNFNNQLKVIEVIEYSNEYIFELNNINSDTIIELSISRLGGIIPKFSLEQIDNALDELLIKKDKENIWRFALMFKSDITNQYKIEDFFIEESDSYYITEYLCLMIENVNQEKMLKQLIKLKSYEDLEFVYGRCDKISDKLKKEIEMVIKENEKR